MRRSNKSWNLELLGPVLFSGGYRSARYPLLCYAMLCYAMYRDEESNTPCSGHVYWRDSEGKRGGDLFIGGDSGCLGDGSHVLSGGFEMFAATAMRW